MAHHIIDDWARRSVEVVNRRPGQIFKDTSPFTLMPRQYVGSGHLEESVKPRFPHGMPMAVVAIVLLT